MAKKRIKKYIFFPGTSGLSNAYPNAYSLITSNINFIKKEARAYIQSRVTQDTAVNYFPVATQLLEDNKEFILKEMSAWIKKQISDGDPTFANYNYSTTSESKCERDVGYLIDSYIYDLTYGGNERTLETNSFFYINGVSQLLYPEQEAATHVFLTELITTYVLESSPWPTTQIDNPVSQVLGASAEPAAIAKAEILSNISVDVISSGLSAAPPKEFNLAFANYTYNADKCERDIGYVLDAYLWDLRYNGNRNTRKVAEKYWIADTPQVDGNRQAEVQTHSFIRDLINNYIIPSQLFPTLQTPVLAQQILDVTKPLENGSTSKIQSLTQLLISVINNGLGALPPLEVGVGLAYIQGKWTLDEILLITNVSKNIILYNFADPSAGSILAYADPTTPDIDTQIDYGFTGIVLNKETLAMDPSDELQIFVEDYEELRVRPYDFGTDAIERQRVAQSQSMLDADFEYGLQPTKWQALALSRSYPGTYEVPGTEIRVLSVVTDASAATGGIGQSLITVTTEGAHGLVPGRVLTMRNLDPAVRGFSRAEGVFVCNTTPTSTTFTYYAKARVGTAQGVTLELGSTQFRRSEFFTGAALGGATFSIFSQGASGTFSPSLIIPQGTTAIPFTGSIPIVNAPVIYDGGIDIGTTITSVVGTGSADTVIYSNVLGQNISGIGVDAEFEIERTSGTYTVTVTSSGIGYAVGDQIIVFGTDLDGTTPGNDCLITVDTIDTAGEILTVISSGTGIASGVASSNQLLETAAAGTTIIELVDSTGILPGLSFNRGDNTPTVVNTIDGNTITISRPLTQTIFGSSATFNNISANSIVGTGVNATFDIDRNGLTYSGTIATAGTGYQVGDTLSISGTLLSGNSGTNDAYITVTSVGAGGSITGILVDGVGLDFNSYTGVATTNITGQGSGATFNIQRSASIYIGVTTSSAGVNYVVDDILLISGSALDGSSPQNDIRIIVTTVGVLGDITGFTFTGDAQQQQNDYVSPNFTTSGVGTGASFTVTSIGDTYVNVAIDNSGDIVRTAKTNTFSGDTLLSETEKKYGSTSLRILNSVSPATADSHLDIVASSDFAFGTAPFSIELDVFLLENGVNQTIFDMRQAASDPAILLGVDPTDHLYLFVNGSIVVTGSTALLPNTWYHIEISSTDRSVSGNTRIFLDGTEVANWTDTTNYGTGYTTVPIVIGADYLGAGDGLRGYIDEIRVSDIARNTTAYTAPTSAFLHDSNTILLMHFDGPNFSVSTEDDVGGYKLDETILILGSELGGVDSVNDLTINIISVSLGRIQAITYAGLADDTATYSNIASSSVTGQGSGLTFDVVQNGTQYQNIVINAGGSDYVVNDRIRIPGTSLDGASPANDIVIKLISVGFTGDAATFEIISGTAASSSDSFADLASTNIQSRGQSAVFTIGKENQNYSVNTIDVEGTNYRVGNRLRVSGSNLSGSPILNDAIITVNTIDGNGGILTASITGTASGGETINFFSTITLSDPTIGAIPTNAVINFSAVAKIQVSFQTFHGLVPGSGILVQILSSGLNQNLAAGTFFVEEVPEPNVIRYTARSSGNIQEGGFTGEIYSRTDAFFVHRPFDGGVQLGTGGPQHAAQAIRMSKNYIRYQSGKGLMYTTGALFAPSFDLSSAVSDGVRVGSNITFKTDDVDHGLQVGAEITIINVETSGYNNTYTVNNIIDEQTFQVQAVQQLGSIEAKIGNGQVSLFKWSGATVRAGCFDDQNGMYWQYDGARIAVGVRSATFQLVGTVTANPNSNLLIGLNTKFRDQLIAGDKIVLRGMTHTVSHVVDQTTLYVTPDFRGVSTVTKAKICKIIDRIFYQDEWNRDPGDGTGPSGYNIDVTKMQMIGIQYTWYGAGFIDFMLRGKEGNFLFVHRVRNNNVNTEAYMRSANLPVRYEVINDGAYGKLSTDLTPSSTIIAMDTTENFPESGIIYVDNELISYNSKTTSTLTGLTRSATLQNFVAGSQRSYTAGAPASHQARTGVILVSNKTSPIISHWGSAYLTDGGFDEDRGYLFNYQATSFIATTVRNTAFLIRLSPSVSNAVVGDLGERELINRAQLLLQGIEVTAGTGTASGIVVEGILNPSNYPANAESIEWRTLASPGLGGQPSFAQVALGSTAQWDNQFTVSFNATTVDNRNRPTQLRFLASEVANVRVGMTVSSPTSGIAALIPGGTLVSGISGVFNIAGLLYREVFFNRQFTGNIPNGTSISFSSIAAYAAPGETIFSFVGLPNNQTALDLTSLKEITNTAIGGRGVFPNGPDVLAINCYLTGGNQQEVSIVLRWKEAQA